MPGNALRDPKGRRAWSLTSSAFERLLAVLDADRERAAVSYEQLRQRIIGLLQWWGCTDAEHLADETLDRVSRKLEEGAVVPPGSLGAYVRGVARMIFYEGSRQPAAAPVEEELPAAPAADDSEAAFGCLDRCLAACAADERSLVLRYYDAGKAADRRRRLAAELGISPAALRVRSHRARARLEHCVSACLDRP